MLHAMNNFVKLILPTGHGDFHRCVDAHTGLTRCGAVMIGILLQTLAVFFYLNVSEDCHYDAQFRLHLFKKVNSCFPVLLTHILCTILADAHSFISIPLFRFFKSSKKSLYKFCFCHPTWVVQPHVHPL
jgi:hypothetical protein